jgi:glycopeptide antibiotics resistance protein
MKEKEYIMESRKITKYLFTIYLLALVWIILFKLQLSFANLPYLRNVNLIPFGDSTIVNGTIDFSEIAYNLVVFIPFGLFIAMLWENVSFPKKVVPVLLTSLGFEVIQFVLAIGASDITDLLMNTAGGMVGIGLFYILSKLLKDKTVPILNAVCLIGAVSSFFFIGLILFVNL